VPAAGAAVTCDVTYPAMSHTLRCTSRAGDSESNRHLRKAAVGGCVRRTSLPGGSARGLIPLPLSFDVYTELTKHTVAQIVLVASKHEEDVSALIQNVIVALSGRNFFNGNQDALLDRSHKLALPREQLSVWPEKALAERLNLAARLRDGFFLLLLFFVCVEKLSGLVFLPEFFDAVARILNLGSPLLLHLIQLLLYGLILRQPVENVLAVDVPDFLLRLHGRGADARPEKKRQRHKGSATG